MFHGKTERILVTLFPLLLGPSMAAEPWVPLPSADVVGRPAVVRGDAGRLVVFAIRPDRAVWYTATDSPGNWSAWASLGGKLCLGSEPVAAEDSSGRLYVFATTCDGRVWHQWEDVLGDPHSWTGIWRQPRRTLDQPAKLIDGRPVVVRNVDGLLQLFALMPNGTVGTIRQPSADPYAIWTPWEDLGGDLEGELAGAANADGRLEVFGRMADGSLWHLWQLVPQASSGWAAAWQELPGVTAGAHEVMRNQDGRLELFARTGDGYLRSTSQLAPNVTTAWKPWQDLGGEVTGLVGQSGDLQGGLAVVGDEAGRAGVFARDGNGNLWSQWQKRPNAEQRSYWTSLCGPSEETPAVASGRDEPTDVFVTRSDGSVWTKRCGPHCLGEKPKVIPVLNYHGINDLTPGSPPLFVYPAEFRAQLESLASQDPPFTPVLFEDLENLCEIERPVLLTFDDGLVDNYVEMYPILGEESTAGFEAIATVGLISGRFLNPSYLSPTQVVEMLDRVSFQSHTKTHPHLPALAESDLISELDSSISEIEAVTEEPVTVLIYPFGEYDDDVLEATAARFHHGVSTHQSLYRLGQDRYVIPRRFVNRSYDIDAFEALLTLCEHSEYEEGEALELGCGGGWPTGLWGFPESNCTTAVCFEHDHPECCDAEWDKTCVELARTWCDVGVW